MNRLILGDCLEVLKTLPAESVDLIYLDPPFFSNRHYEIVWGDKGEIRSFEDRWAGGVDHYIAWLKERVAEMHRILKPTGSIFLHCDWHANAYIRVLILDRIFGYDNFRGEIVWQRHNAHNDAKKKISVLTDSIYFYSKSGLFTYHPVYAKHSEKYKDDFYKYDDNDGKGLYQLADMAAPEGGGMSAINKETGKPNGWYVYKGYQPPERGWRYMFETMEKLDAEGRIHFPKNKDGTPAFDKRLRLKRYLNEQTGNLLGNLWNDIQNIQHQSAERIGYPTQKPLALLERIISCASNEGDTVLDPFLGGGTTVLAAERLKRNWLGVDQSPAAIKVTEMRLQKEKNLFSSAFMVSLHKYDYDTLRYKDAFEFETWIVERYGGVANAKQRSDFGLDGKTREGLPMQVKRSDNVGRNVLDNFVSAAKRADKALFDKNIAEGKPVGVIIAFSFGKGATQEAARLKNEENVVVELVTVEQIVPIAKKPTLVLDFEDLGTDDKGAKEIKFTATAESGAGIEFFGWEWNHDEQKGFRADVYFDKAGVQTQKFKPGNYAVAVKVVDGDGLENVEVVRLTVNGGVRRR